MVKAKKTPKGGSKGGTRFPRLSLSKAIEYSKKLVSKTHIGAHPATVILPGVFGSAGPLGQVRASALKQYGLLDGTPKAYEASELAKQVTSATPEDLPERLKTTLLKPKLFRTLFDTFCNDEVTRARIRQQASNLSVHPDSLDECVETFVNSAISAGLANEEGDKVRFHAAPKLVKLEKDTEDGEENELEPESDAEERHENTDDAAEEESLADFEDSHKRAGTANLEIKIDPSMDPEKLDKLLGVLKKYGQI